MPNFTYRARVLAVLSAAGLGACSISPQPFSDAELKEAAGPRLSKLEASRVPVGGTLTLSEAIRRAVAHNLDHRSELFEIALRQAELEVASAAMLPSLAANAGRSHRDSPTASSSLNLITGVQNFGHSTSQDQQLHVANLELSWNVLDFGLSYVRARQTADKVLIAAEMRRRVAHRIVEEIRAVYFRAYAAEQLHDRLRRLERRTAAALMSSHRQVQERTTSPIVAITYRRELIEIKRTLQELQRELASARIQLVALINANPDAKFRLAPPTPGQATARLANQRIDSLVQLGLEQRAELRELAYKKRINAHEVHAALLELLPGITPYVGNNFDSNSFILHSQWLNWGARASWNVMRLFQYPRKRELIEASQELLEHRELAMAATVVMQIHVSRVRIGVLERELGTASAYLDTQNLLLAHIRAESAADRVSEQSLLREELGGVVAQVRWHVIQSHLESAHAALTAAVGIDPPGLEQTRPVQGPAGHRAHDAVASARRSE